MELQDVSDLLSVGGLLGLGIDFDLQLASGSLRDLKQKLPLSLSPDFQY